MTIIPQYRHSVALFGLRFWFAAWRWRKPMFDFSITLGYMQGYGLNLGIEAFVGSIGFAIERDKPEDDQWRLVW